MTGPALRHSLWREREGVRGFNILMTRVQEFFRGNTALIFAEETISRDGRSP